VAPTTAPPAEKQLPARKDPPPRSPGAAVSGVSYGPKDEQARSALEQAEKALETRNGAEARFRAQQSLRSERSGRAFAVLTRAYCLERDLSNAMAQYSNVPRPLRAACQKWCAEFDIELGAR
jgi:serine/threonine-protein kinase